MSSFIGCFSFRKLEKFRGMDVDLAILIIFSRDQASLLIVIFACDRKAFTAGDEESFPPLKDDENPSLAKLDLHKSLRDSSPGSIIVIIDFSERLDQDVSNSIVASNWIPASSSFKKDVDSGTFHSNFPCRSSTAWEGTQSGNSSSEATG